MTDQEKLNELTRQIKEATVMAHRANSHAAAVKYMNMAYRLQRIRSRILDRVTYEH
jgi:hypothetical protein